MKRTSSKITLLWTVLVFIILFLTGLWLSQKKMLWNDEIYTHMHSIGLKSYADILTGKVTEGNNAPLFYLLQKGLSQVLSFKFFPQDWTGEKSIYNPQAQWILRLVPNFSMSLMLAVLFYFFARHYALWLGCVSLAVGLTTVIVWEHWVEARPYGLWMLLTTLQALGCIRCATSDEKPSVKPLVVVHILLSLTIFFGIIQIMIVSAILWFKKFRDLKMYIGITLIPLSVSLFYYAFAPKYKFGFRETPFELFFDCFPPEFIVMVVCAAILGKFVTRAKLSNGINVFVWALLSALALSGVAVIGLLFLKFHSGTEGFFVVSRYFAYLTPVAIMLATYSVWTLVQGAKRDRWMLFNVLFGLGGLLVIRAVKTAIDIYASGAYQLIFIH